MVILVVALLIVALIVIFSVQNASSVTLSFLAWQFSASLAIVVFLSLVCGVIITALFFLSMRLRSRKARSAAEKERPEKSPPGKEK